MDDQSRRGRRILVVDLEKKKTFLNTSTRCPEHWSCYGRMGDNLPPPEEVSIMYLEYGIGKMRMYDADSIVIGAF